MNRGPIPLDEADYIWPLHGTTMLELGNKKNPDGVYKDHFESLGIRHTSIDWNGEDGALAMDLREPINVESIGGPFDMVTNIGTTEHVSDQAAVWANIHSFVKVGGILVSVTPYPGFWWWHGEYYPTSDFFTALAEQNGYEIIKRGVHYLDAIKANLYVRLIKRAHAQPFIMPPPEFMYKNELRPRNWRPSA